MTHYVVVTRKQKLPIQRFMTLAAAADKIVYERKFSEWTVLAQDGRTAAKARKLTAQERRELERRLYPSLFE